MFVFPIDRLNANAMSKREWGFAGKLASQGPFRSKHDLTHALLRFINQDFDADRKPVGDTVAGPDWAEICRSSLHWRADRAFGNAITAARVAAEGALADADNDYRHAGKVALEERSFARLEKAETEHTLAFNQSRVRYAEAVAIAFADALWTDHLERESEGKEEAA
ncbi:MAG: hypothetical protein AAGB11_13840 [Pseudomonadota bacterium]